MTDRRDLMNYIGTGAIGGIIGYYVGAQKLLGIQSDGDETVSNTQEPTEEATEDSSRTESQGEIQSNDDETVSNSQEPTEDSSETESQGEFLVTQGSISTFVTPIKSTETIESVFDYTGFTSELRLQEEDTARLFLYDGPNGLSFGTIIDSVASDDGGSTRYEIEGLPESGNWVVKDDPGDTYGDSPSWSWDGGGNTDGGAFLGGLDGDFEIQITVQLNEGRDDPQNTESGTVDRLEFVSDDLSVPDILELDTGDSAPPVTIRRSG
jgi:hypothetical protein